jgi:RHS repeat-associated protein
MPRNILQQGFQTDNANQLVNVSRNNNLLTVAGSLSNSVTSLTINGQTATVYNDLTWAVPGGITVTNGQNQLTAVVTAGGLTQTTSVLQTLPATVALRYDTDGNLIGDGLLAYTYDCADELTAVTLTNGWKTGYVYDGLGRRRIRKDYTWTNNVWAETNEVHYVYAGMNVIQERNSNNVPLVTYTRGVDLSGTRQGAGGIGGLLARTDANGTACYHTDGNGNVTALVNGSGTQVAKYLYDSFGNTLGMWGSLAAANTYRFSSKEMDPRTGQYYYGYRWYDPNLQRWLNQDPIGEEGGLNLCGFVENNPINRIDPLGLDDNSDGEDPLDRMMNRLDNGNYTQGGDRWTAQEAQQAANDVKGVGVDAAMILASAATGGAPELAELKGVPGTYKVCLNNGKSYVGKAVDIAKRLAQHVKAGKWKWNDIKAIFAEPADTEKLRRIREIQRLMEETGGAHPKDAQNVLNKIMPPKP